MVIEGVWDLRGVVELKDVWWNDECKVEMVVMRD